MFVLVYILKHTTCGKRHPRKKMHHMENRINKMVIFQNDIGIRDSIFSITAIFNITNLLPMHLIDASLQHTGVLLMKEQ